MKILCNLTNYFFDVLVLKAVPKGRGKVQTTHLSDVSKFVFKIKLNNYKCLLE